MKSKKRSRTAQMAAVIRALHFAYESPAVFKTLSSIQSCAGLESELVFDYAISEKHYSHQDHKTINDLKRYTKRRGEPILSTFDPEIFPQQVSQLGFVLMENLSPEEQAKRYFNATDRGEKIMPGSYFIHFRVMGK